MKLINDGKKIIADENKILLCKCHNKILGTEINLKQIMKNGELIMDTVDNYIEIDKPEREHLD